MDGTQLSQWMMNPNKHKDLIGAAIIAIAHGIADRMRYSHKEARDDVVGEIVLQLFRTIPKYKPENGPAFNYFTTVAINAAKMWYRTRKKALKFGTPTEFSRDIDETCKRYR